MGSRWDVTGLAQCKQQRRLGITLPQAKPDRIGCLYEIAIVRETELNLVADVQEEAIELAAKRRLFLRQGVLASLASRRKANVAITKGPLKHHDGLWISRVRAIKQAYLHDSKADVAQQLANEAQTRLSIDAKVCVTAKEATSHADIIVTATWASKPFLFDGDIRPGTHITTLGP